MQGVPAVEAVQLKQLARIVAVARVCQPAQQRPVQHHLRTVVKLRVFATDYLGTNPVQQHCP